jgi:hypothetical protein
VQGSFICSHLKTESVHRHRHSAAAVRSLPLNHVNILI